PEVWAQRFRNGRWRLNGLSGRRHSALYPDADCHHLHPNPSSIEEEGLERCATTRRVPRLPLRRTSMTPRRLPALLTAIAALAVMAMASANAKFTAFPVKPAFGKRVMPTFRGSNHKYSEFRTALTDGFRTGPHFAGHYVLIGIGCGAGCRTFYLGDLN